MLRDRFQHSHRAVLETRNRGNRLSLSELGSKVEGGPPNFSSFYTFR
jgi:hypothetical protein